MTGWIVAGALYALGIPIWGALAVSGAKPPPAWYVVATCAAWPVLTLAMVITVAAGWEAKA